jgi:hypothetical protein
VLALCRSQAYYHASRNHPSSILTSNYEQRHHPLTSVVPEKRDLRTKAGLWDSIRSGLLKTSPTSVTEPERKEDEFDLVEGEVVLVEKVQTDGTVEKIVFASGAEVDVYELELLCDKVGWPRRPPSKVAAALRNSYMVASLHLYTQPSSAGNPLFCNTFCLSYERNRLPW